MTERQPFPNNKAAADFDALKLAYCWNPSQDVTVHWKVCWSPGGCLVATSPGDSTVTLAPWDKSSRRLADCVQTDGLQYNRHVVYSGKPVKAIALGSSRTGSLADFGNRVQNDANSLIPGQVLNTEGGQPDGSGDGLHALVVDGGHETRQSGDFAHGVRRTSWFRFKKIEGLVLTIGFQSGQIRCYNAHTGDLILELLDHQQPVLDLQFTPNGSLRLASCSADGTVKLWDLTDDGNMYRTLTVRGYKGPIHACAWSPDGCALVMVGQMGMVSLWDINDDEITQRHMLHGHHHNVMSCDFSADGGLLLTASLDSFAILWSPYLGTILRKFGHLFPPPSLIFASGANTAGVLSAVLCSDSQHMVTICEDRYIRVWNLYTEDGPLQVLKVPEPGPGFCKYSPDGSVITTGPFDKGMAFLASPYGKPPGLRHLSRSCFYHQLQRRGIPGRRSAEVIQSLVAEGFLPRDLRDFLLYKTL